MPRGYHVAEEASKQGIVERCFVYLVPQYSPENPIPDDEAVRVFVVFTGLVGAWNAVKQFDGRYFGGRAVRAR